MQKCLNVCFIFNIYLVVMNVQKNNKNELVRNRESSENVLICFCRCDGRWGEETEDECFQRQNARLIGDCYT